MKNGIFFILLFFCLQGFSQSPIGVYTDLSKAEKQTDSLILNADSSYRYAFYYPKYQVSEYYEGTWRYKDNTLFLNNSGLKQAAFILTATISNGGITQLLVTNAKLRKGKKGQVLLKN